MTTTSSASIGAVVIGRNEGERLKRSLRSLLGHVKPIIYVDSQSSDDSVASAHSLGVEVVELDLSVPFTAARARNVGFNRLCELAPDIDFVQFVDGDCEVAERWIEVARETLVKDASIVAVTGVRRELHPERSVYNELCDVEWRQGPYGETDRFGGDVLIRAANFIREGGYNPTVIAAEDDELAVRLCKAGGRILRLDCPMTLHDATMYRLSQWWRRAKRCGYGYAQVGHLHGGPPFNKFRAERRRVLVWALGFPAALLALAPFTLGISLLLAVLYPLRALRVAHNAWRGGRLSVHASAAWGLSCIFSSFPEAVGMAKFQLERLLQRTPTIIEYKEPKAP